MSKQRAEKERQPAKVWLLWQIGEDFRMYCGDEKYLNKNWYRNLEILKIYMKICLTISTIPEKQFYFTNITLY